MVYAPCSESVIEKIAKDELPQTIWRNFQILIEHQNLGVC